MKIMLSLSGILFASSLGATELPQLPFHQEPSSYKLFISSSNDQQEFDTWKVDGGYSYNLFDKIDLYVGARIDSSEGINETGFLSGVSYQVTPRVSLTSTVHSYNIENQSEEERVPALSAEVSSRVRLTENLDLHATLDYQEWQQEVEFGLGFRF